MAVRGIRHERRSVRPGVAVVHGALHEPDWARAGRPPAVAIPACGLVGLLLLAAIAQARGVVPWAVRSSAGTRPAAQTAPPIDPRLIVTPRTLTKAAMAGGLRLALRVRPLLPGPNRFELRLAGRGRPVVAARVQLVLRMPGMAMRPVILPLSEAQPGRYAATGPLAMFGQWQVNVRIERPGAASLVNSFKQRSCATMPASVFRQR